MKFTKAMAVGKEILAKTRPTFDSIILSSLGDYFVSKFISLFMCFISYPLGIGSVCYQKKKRKKMYCTIMCCFHRGTRFK